MTQVDEILDRLDGVKRSGNGWMAFCPAHDDRTKQSLSITEGDSGMVLWNCRAGCSQEAVGALLRPSGGSKWDAGRAEAVYDYVDENGSLLFQVLRMPGKEFPSRHQTDEGWKWGLKDVRRVPYNLPGLIAAVAAGKWIVVVEGEKDVAAGKAAGEEFFFTCSPGGAGKWRAEYARLFKGARVIVWADKDEPGRSHAQDVKASLVDVAASVAGIEAKEGKDAHDHLVEHGLPIQEAVSIEIRDSSDETMLSEVESKNVEWHFKPFVQVAAFHLLAGDGGIGKGSWLAYLTALITTGKTEHLSEPQNVLVVASEDSAEVDLKPRVVAAGGDPSRVFVLKKHVLLPRDIAYLEAKIEQKRNGCATGLVIIDPISNHIGGTASDEGDGAVRKAINDLNAIAERTNCTLFAVRHINKGGSGGVNSILGSVAWKNLPRVVLMLNSLSTGAYDSGSRVLRVEKSNRGKRGQEKHYKLIGTHVDGIANEVPLIVPDGRAAFPAPEQEAQDDAWFNIIRT